MIYLVKKIDSANNILYICSDKDIDDVLNDIQNIDYDYLTSDNGIISHLNDPFLLADISIN